VSEEPHRRIANRSCRVLISNRVSGGQSFRFIPSSRPSSSETANSIPSSLVISYLQISPERQITFRGAPSAWIENRGWASRASRKRAGNDETDADAYLHLLGSGTSSAAGIIRVGLSSIRQTSGFYRPSLAIPPLSSGSTIVPLPLFVSFSLSLSLSLRRTRPLPAT